MHAGWPKYIYTRQGATNNNKVTFVMYGHIRVRSQTCGIFPGGEKERSFQNGSSPIFVSVLTRIYTHADVNAREQAAARESIEYHQVRFHGNAEYDENGQFFIPNPSPIDYIGPPSPAVDDAWRNLTGGEYLYIIFLA
ncbi:hypothetical protein Trisim1_000792 [Trichoderma cf. simile WF8]